MYKLKQAIFIALFFIAPIYKGLAQQGKYVWKEKTEGGYTYRFVENDPTQACFYQLKNGLTVILSPTSKQPRIQAYITTKAGSKVDPKSHTGLAHSLEHLLFKGTSKMGTLDWAKEKPLLDQIEALYEQYNHTVDETARKNIYREIDRVSGEAAKYAIANEYDKIMSSIGAEGTNAFTSFDQTAYTEDIPNNAVDQFLAVQAERFRDPIFRLFHTELETVYEEKNMSLDNDNNKATEALMTAIFPNHTYGQQTILGSVDHLKNPSLQAIRQFYETYYVPNHMAVVMSGDFNPTEIIIKVDQAFSYLQSRAVPSFNFDTPPPLTRPVIREVVGPKPEFVVLAYRLPGAASKEAKMLNLITNMLSNGNAGLIDLNIVKSQKLLRAAAYDYVLNDYSMLMLEGHPLQGQTLEQAKDLLLGELAKLKDGAFSTDLIASIVNNEQKTRVRRSERYKDRASDLMAVFASDLDWAEELHYSEWLSSVTKEDVIAFVKQYFTDEGYVAVYKRQGQDPNTLKVVKPAITPVKVNRVDQSAFFSTIEKVSTTPIQPVWIDYEVAIQRSKLDGLPLYAAKNSDNDLFTLTYYFKSGQWNNKLLGLAAGYLEFLGTDSKTSEDFSREFYKLATDFRIVPGNEETTISVSGLNTNFERSITLVQELINTCVADEDAFSSYIGVLKKSRANAKENKRAIVEGLMAYAKYGAKNPFNFTFTDAELDQLRADDLVKAIHDLANTEHEILYHGPLTIQELMHSTKPLKRKPGRYHSPVEEIRFTEVPTVESKVFFTHFPMNQVDISWFRNAGEYNSRNTPLVTLFNSYFGGGMGSIVFQTIRESKALAYSTYAGFVQPFKSSEPYTIRAYVGTQADKFNEAIEGMNELLDDLPQSDIALAAAKTNLMKSIESQRITDLAILNSYINAQRLGINTDIRKNVYKKMADITYNDLRDFHTKEFSNKPYVYCIVGEEASLNEEDMKKLGALKKLSLEEIFGY